MTKEYLKYKKYAHFDKKMSIKKFKRLLLTDDIISKHGFFPFIHYQIKSKKLDKTKEKLYAKKEPKIREIYYCAHLDRYIYQHYAHILGQKYNDYMIKENIDNCSGAYRIERGKCNVDFSYEVFKFIKQSDNAIIFIGDFTNFFDNLNHIKLKRRLETVLNSKLDNNFYKIFKSLTKFKYINMEELYDYFTIRNNKRSEKYYIRKLNQLMSIEEFKKFIVDINPKTGLKYLKENNKNYGIVQGSPLSGLLANIYMIEFDKQMNDLSKKYKGKYLRYSDDFILVLNDVNEDNIINIYKIIQKKVNDAGQIELKSEKTNIFEYKNKNITCLNNKILNTTNVPNIINFLGFSFDGKDISIRSKTITKYYYKMYRKIKRYKSGKKDVTRKQIYDKFSSQGSNKKRGNFISYVNRAKQKFKGEEKISLVSKNSKKKVTEVLGKMN